MHIMVAGGYFPVILSSLNPIIRSIQVAHTLSQCCDVPRNGIRHSAPYRGVGKDPPVVGFDSQSRVSPKSLCQPLLLRILSSLSEGNDAVLRAS